MSRTPMYNRFVEGFVESHSWGDTIDALSSRILPGHPALDAGTLARHARAARDAAIRAALSTGWAALRRGAAALGGAFHPLRHRLAAWRERRNATSELCALDDRTLAELGLRRGEIPFVVARPATLRDERPTARPGRRPAAADNDNRPRESQAGAERDSPVLPIYFVK